MAGDRPRTTTESFAPTPGNPEHPLTALTIAGSDSSGGAGLQMDLRVFTAHGVWGGSAATLLTAQTTLGVERMHHLPPRFVGAQIDAAARDLRPAAVKTGALGRAQVVHVVAGRVRRRRIANLVVDPVILAKDGSVLLNPRGVAAMQKRLLPLARVVTPNLPEAETLAGIRINDDASLREAARTIAGSGAAVVIKGGHRPDAPVDLLFDGERFAEFRGERLPGPALRGTGCIYSAALAARLAMGCDLEEACALAKEFVGAAIRAGLKVGKGAPVASILCAAGDRRAP